MASSEKEWVNGTTPTCAAEDLNGFKLENNNLIESMGATLDDEDHDQTGEAVSAYSSVGNFYTGSGSANTYAANPVGDYYGIPSLINGAQIRFVVSATNTGASTVNVNSLGVKNLKNWDGSALVGSELVAGEEVTIKYNSGSSEWRLVNRDSLLSLLPPVGTVLPFMDYNGAATFDSNYWAYMDGSVLSDSDSPLDGETLTDLSGRYLVGFGTDGGEDIDSAAWSVTPVGNAGHTVDLEHSHTVDSHDHDVAYLASNEIRFYETTFGGSNFGTIAEAAAFGGGGLTALVLSFTGASPPFNAKSSAETPGTNNQLSTTQSIQPRSIPCRFIIRIK
jgi:hypothetical protein